MAEYSLEDEAEYDLLEIGRYTTRTWSVDKAVRYLSALEDHFEALSKRDALEREVFDHREDYPVSRCQHHYVFFVRERDDHVLILAVLHESMDLIARFRERIDRGGMGS